MKKKIESLNEKINRLEDLAKQMLEPTLEKLGKAIDELDIHFDTTDEPEITYEMIQNIPPMEWYSIGEGCNGFLVPLEIKSPVVVYCEFVPGARIGHHTHDCKETIIMLEGDLYDLDTTKKIAGRQVYEANTLHGSYTIHGCKIFVIFDKEDII